MLKGKMDTQNKFAQIKALHLCQVVPNHLEGKKKTEAQQNVLYVKKAIESIDRAIAILVKVVGGESDVLSSLEVQDFREESKMNIRFILSSEKICVISEASVA